MKKLSIMLVLILLLGGCGYGKDVENQAFVVAVGIDKGKSFPVKATFVFADPNGGGSGGGGEEKPSTPKPDTVTVEAPTVFSALRKIDSIKSKTLNMSHIKIVVFSDEIAKEGIRDYLSGFASSRDFRPNTYVCVSQGDAEKYLKKVKPSHETFIEKYYDNIMSKVAHDKVNEAYLYYLYFNVMEDFSGSLVPLVGINKNEIDKPSSDVSDMYDDFSYEARAGEIVRDAQNPTEVLGCAVFRNDKMIDTLGSFKTDLARIICNEYYPRNYSIAYPTKKEFVTIRLIQKRSPVIDGTVKNGKAHIKVEVPLSIEYIDAGKIENHKNKSAQFCAFLEKTLDREAKELIKDAQSSYRADVLGLGEAVKHQFIDVSAWKKFDWEKKFSNAQIDVSFNVMYADFEEAN
ncbi:MAG: Ger(x)C family spore germination protein [Clostridia bacterium]|nr:Ger(x)C family spore germination protein [Clostridia bacterium]